MSDKPKVETVEEFVARGGIIKKYPAVMPDQDNLVRSTAKPDNQDLMSLDEGAHFFSEIKPKKTRKKKDPLKDIDISKLPANIRELMNI